MRRFKRTTRKYLGNGNYIVLITKKKKNGELMKNAKRHIYSRYETVEEAEERAKLINRDSYKIELVTGNYTLIKEL